MSDQECALVLESVHFVMKAETLVKSAGLYCDLIPVPRNISSECGMALCFHCVDLERVMTIIDDHGLPVVGSYRREAGTFRPLR